MLKEYKKTEGIYKQKARREDERRYQMRKPEERKKWKGETNKANKEVVK